MPPTTSTLSLTLVAAVLAVAGTASARSIEAPADTTLREASVPAMTLMMTDDPEGPPCGDLDGDGAIGLSDLLIVLETFGTDDLSGDVNQSGQVNFADIVLLLVQWGGTCA